MPSIVMCEKGKVLSRIPLFRDLPLGVMEEIGSYAKIVHYKANGTIFHKGDAGDSMMAIIHGRVKISCWSPDGRELVLNIIKPGEVLGEIALLDGQERTADAIALENSNLLVLERRYFLAFLSKHPNLYLNVITLLCKRVRQTSEQFEDCLFLELPPQVARCLIRLADLFGRPVHDGLLIDLKLPQRQFGGLIGRSRESVNRQLHQFQSAKLITTKDGYITIIDMNSLKALAKHTAE